MSDKTIINSITRRKGVGKSKILNRLKLWTVAAVSVASLSLMPVQSVFASTDWDNLLVITPDLDVVDINSVDVTDSYMSIMEEECFSAYAAFIAAVGSANGRWAIKETNIGGPKFVEIVWSTDTGHVTNYTYSGSDPIVTVSYQGKATLVEDWPSGEIECNSTISNGSLVLAYVSFGDVYSVFINTYPDSPPSGYVGLSMPTPDYTDSDGDGIDNFTEAGSYPLKLEVFCDTAANPMVCAEPNPSEQDIFVEVDWMVKDSTELKPTSGQLETVQDAFENQGINLHFDTGQYGGGDVVDYEAELEFSPDTGVDFYDYKRGGDGQSANFSGLRYGIWRYMISGDTYNDGDPLEVSSGVAFPGDDDLFISYDGLKSDSTAVSGTIMHELGHILCLTPEPAYPATVWYTGQDADCIFAGVHSDNTNHPNYDSSMNYDEQFTRVDFSDGSNGSGDHDDWSAVGLKGIDDFALLNTTDPSEPSFGAIIAQNTQPQPIKNEVSVDKATQDSREDQLLESKKQKKEEVVKDETKDADERTTISKNDAMLQPSSPRQDAGKSSGANMDALLLLASLTSLAVAGAVVWRIKRRQ